MVEQLTRPIGQIGLPRGGGGGSWWRASRRGGPRRRGEPRRRPGSTALAELRRLFDLLDSYGARGPRGLRRLHRARPRLLHRHRVRGPRRLGRAAGRGGGRYDGLVESLGGRPLPAGGLRLRRRRDPRAAGRAAASCPRCRAGSTPWSTRSPEARASPDACASPRILRERGESVELVLAAVKPETCAGRCRSRRVHVRVYLLGPDERPEALRKVRAATRRSGRARGVPPLPQGRRVQPCRRKPPFCVRCELDDSRQPGALSGPHGAAASSASTSRAISRCSRAGPRPRHRAPRLLEDLRQRGLRTPLLLRFSDILAARVRRLADAFRPRHRRVRLQGALPRRLPDQGEPAAPGGGGDRRVRRRFGIGLEAGSKPELLIALALLDTPDALIICNGYKDREYIETALLAQQLGRTARSSCSTASTSSTS